MNTVSPHAIRIDHDTLSAYIMQNPNLGYRRLKALLQSHGYVAPAHEIRAYRKTFLALRSQLNPTPPT